MSTPTPAGVPANLKQQLHDLATRIDAYRKAFDARKDSRTIFAYTYVLINRQLADALDTAGFGDPAWIVQLAQAFAGKYIAALDAPARSSGLAPAWAVVFDTIRNKRTSVLEVSFAKILSARDFNRIECCYPQRECDSTGT